jgi:hypothetical protein
MQRPQTTTGSKFTVRGQIYIQTGAFYHPMSNDREVRVLELQTICSECSETFRAGLDATNPHSTIDPPLSDLPQDSFRTCSHAIAIEAHPWPEDRREGAPSHSAASPVRYRGLTAGLGRKDRAARSTVFASVLAP